MRKEQQQRATAIFPDASNRYFSSNFHFVRTAEAATENAIKPYNLHDNDLLNQRNRANRLK